MYLLEIHREIRTPNLKDTEEKLSWILFSPVNNKDTLLQFQEYLPY